MSAPTTTHIATAVTDHLPGIQRLAREYGVARLEVFGDAATEELGNPLSPVYLMVTYPPDYDFGSWAERYTGLWENLKHMVNRDVHLLMSTATLDNDTLKTMIQESRATIYAAS